MKFLENRESIVELYSLLGKITGVVHYVDNDIESGDYQELFKCLYSLRLDFINLEEYRIPE